MAGAKGRSGGSRANSGGARPNSGGARAGAGRKRKAASESAANVAPPPAATADPATGTPLDDGQTREPLEFLEMVMNNPLAPLKDRIRAGIAAAQYRHTKRHDGGKKDEADEKAKKAAGGRFSVRKAPTLKVVGG